MYQKLYALSKCKTLLNFSFQKKKKSQSFGFYDGNVDKVLRNKSLFFG